MPQHIGIVACSAEGAALCYRTICCEGAALLGPHAHPEISMHTHALAEYVRNLERNDWQGVAELMLASAHKLARAGADFLICPDNTIHGALGHIAAQLPLPWLHIAEAVMRQAVARGLCHPGLIGTRWLLESDVYPQRAAAGEMTFLRPAVADRHQIDRIILDELVYGVHKPRSVAYLQELIGGMKRRGCDAVVMACTEIPLILNDTNSPLPTIDSTRVLARAALQRAMQRKVD